MMKCPDCGWNLGEGLRQGQRTTCPHCGKEVQVHYSLREQLRDPIGLLLRDPKYVSKRFQARLLVILVLIVALVIFLIIAGFI